MPLDSMTNECSLSSSRTAALLLFVFLCGITGARADNSSVIESKMAQFDRLVQLDIGDPAFNYAGFNAVLGIGFLDKRISEIPTGRRSCDDAAVSREVAAARERQNRGDIQVEAAEYAREIVGKVRGGSTELPARERFSREAAASFARLISTFTAAGDSRSVEDILHSSLLLAFLLDSRESGYCAHVAAGSAEDKTSRSAELASSGLRRIERPDPGPTSFTTIYLYRPWRLTDRLKDRAGDAPADAEALAKKLSDAAAAMELLYRGIRPPRPGLDPYSFGVPERSPSEALDSEENRLPADAKYGLRLDIPMEMATLRMNLAGNRRPPSFTDEQWRALDHIVASCPPLAHAPDYYVIRIVTDGAQTQGRLVAKLGDDRRTGVTIHLAALDRVARLEADKPGKVRRQLELLSAAIVAAGR
ncbi:MAG: hypothetical protein KGJ84_02015 [Elusimicrobia bacterium]|nr:hypothetical protein [Elusimicrobiota bacterium]